MLRALFNVVKKEVRQTLRDRRLASMLVLGPVLQLVLFGYAVNLEVDQIPTVVCDQDRTSGSRELSGRIFAGDTFRSVRPVLEPREAEAALETGDAAVAVVIPRGFSVHRGRGERVAVQVLVDGTDSVRAQVATQAASQVLSQAPGGLHFSTQARGTPRPTLIPRILYNPRLSTSVYMLPGIVATLLLNVTSVGAALGLARERETGTLEQVLVTPLRPLVLLLGKCLPFVFFGLVDIAAVLLIGSWLFDLPVRGSLVAVGLGSFLYLFSTLSFGVVLATLSANQQQAMLGAFAFMLPAALLSGFLSPIETMPGVLQALTLLNPMRHFLEITRACFLKGAQVQDVAQQLVGLALLGVGLLALAVFRFHKRIA